MSARTYFLVNRLWWAGAMLVAPVVAAIAGDPLAGFLAAAVLVLPALVMFDTDRGWWSAEVKAVPEDRDRSRSERRILTICAAGGLALGLVIALVVG